MKTIQFKKVKVSDLFRLTMVIGFFLLIPDRFVGQITNAGFESWDSVYKSPYQYELDTVYHVPGAICGQISKWKAASKVGVVRTTDSYQDMYALVLHNWYFYAEETLYLNDAINSKPANLSGYYKYQTGGSEGLAKGRLIVALLKKNGTDFDTVGKGVQYFDSSGTYKPFVTPLQYFSQMMPDSISITIVNADRNCKTQGICHLLYLDGLSLSNPQTSLNSPGAISDLTIFPNPVRDFLSVSNVSQGQFLFRLYNVSGEIVINELHLSDHQEIDLLSLEPGIYFYLISSPACVERSGKLVKKQ